MEHGIGAHKTSLKETLYKVDAAPGQKKTEVPKAV